MPSARHWYHCSNSNHGRRWTAARRSPDIFDSREPETPRLCVCPSISACFAARLFSRRNVYCYRTVSARRPVKPYKVWDSVVTGERWLVPPVEMELVQTIDRKTVCEIVDSSHLYYEITGERATLKIRVAQYARSVDVLAGNTEIVGSKERNMLDRFRKFFDIGEPEDYILGRITT